MRHRCLALAAVLPFVAADCATQPDTVRVPGLIADGGAALEVYSGPDTVTAGRPFAAIVFTYGSSSCTTPDGADVSISGLTAEVVPYDRIPTGSVPCTADFAQRPHAVTLRFDTVGTAALTVRGEGFSGGRRVPLRRTFTIVVVPA